MKNEPWVRFGILINPKISEKPADRRNRRPPSVMLLTARSSQRLTLGGLHSALQRWIVARVHRLRQEPLLVVGPELADLGIRLDRGVDEAIALPLAPPDVEGAHHVAEPVEGEGAARRIGQGDASQGLDEGLPVVRLAVRLLHRRRRDLAVDVEAGRVETGNIAVVLHHALDEPLVARRVEIARIRGAGDHANRLVAVALEEGVVARGPASEDGQLEPRVTVLLHELERVGARETLDDRVDAADLRDVRG